MNKREKWSLGISIVVHLLILAFLPFSFYWLGEGSLDGSHRKTQLRVIDTASIPQSIRALIEEPSMITSQVAEARERPQVVFESQQVARQPNVQPTSKKMRSVETQVSSPRPNLVQRRERVVLPSPSSESSVQVQTQSRLLATVDSVPFATQEFPTVAVRETVERFSQVTTDSQAGGGIMVSANLSRDLALKNAGDRHVFQVLSPPSRFGDGKEALVHWILPQYPKAMQGSAQSGTVHLLAVVDEEGRLESVRIEKSSSYDSFDQVALLTVERGWAFHAKGFKYQLPITIEYLFQPDRSVRYQVRTTLGQWERLD